MPVLAVLTAVTAAVTTVVTTAVTTAVTAAVFIRVNQVGYLPDAPKVAVVCSLDTARIASFVVADSAGRVVLGPRRTRSSGSFGPCAATYRLDFTTLRAAGRYVIRAGRI